MNTKITVAAKNNTIHSGTGMTPTAPWTRSFRAASRSDVWSSHLPYAASSVGPSGDSVWRVLNRSAPHGLIWSPSVPASIRSHCGPATERA